MPREATIKEAAAILGVSERTVNRRLSAGELESRTEGRNRIVILPDEAVPTDELDSEAPDGAMTHTSETADAELLTLRVKVDLLSRENERLWQLLAQREAAPVYQLPAPGTELTPRPGLWERIRAHLR